MCDRGTCGSEQIFVTPGSNCGCGVAKCGTSCGNGPCSGCNVALDQWNCGYCANDRTSQRAWALGNEARDTALKSGEAIIPPSGNFNFSPMGAWQPFGRRCTLNDNAGDPLAPPGMHSCSVAPGIWTVVPNWVPCGAMINFYNDGAYINSIYDVSRTMPYARGRGGGLRNAPPVLNPYTWPPPFNPISDLYRR